MRTADCSTILGEDDAIISDALNHASIIDGVRLSKPSGSVTRTTTWRTSIVSSGRCVLSLQAHRDRWRLSMDGIVADLGAICDLAERHKALVDGRRLASVGFMGAHGRGSHEARGVVGRIDVLTGTSARRLRPHPRLHQRAQRDRRAPAPAQPAYLFSNTLAPVIAATSIAVLDLSSPPATSANASSRTRALPKA